MSTASRRDASSVGCHRKPVLRRDPSLQTSQPPSKQHKLVSPWVYTGGRSRFTLCLLPDPNFHWKGICAHVQDRSCNAAKWVPALDGCGQDCRSQGGIPAPGYIYQVPTQAYFITMLYQREVLPSLRFIPQKTKSSKSFCLYLGCRQQQSQVIVLMLLTPRGKQPFLHGALQTARTAVHFTEREAVPKHCKCSVVSSVLTHSIKHHLVFITA